MNRRRVLIETSWNVKMIVIAILSDGVFSINRNIVECKEYFREFIPAATLVLIETSWNVKQINGHTLVSGNSINRNIVECKVTLRLYP